MRLSLKKLIKLKLTDLLGRIWRDDVIIFNIGKAPIGKVVIAVTSEKKVKNEFSY